MLLQRSEGGALGIGGGGDFALFGAQPGNVLTRTTAILAVAFFITSIEPRRVIARPAAMPALDLRPGAGRRPAARTGWQASAPNGRGRAARAPLRAERRRRRNRRPAAPAPAAPAECAQRRQSQSPGPSLGKRIDRSLSTRQPTGLVYRLEVPWRGTSSSPAAWSPRSAKVLASAALGALLQARGYRVRLRKLDPYLNVDPGTMSPYQHGEVFVTDDGAETDLDLGHYERFTGVRATRNDNITTGQIYRTSSRRSGAATISAPRSR